MNSGNNILKNLLHHLVSNPYVYDLWQWLLGKPQLIQKIKQVLPLDIPVGAWILDIGGGTGTNFRLFARDMHYVNLDIEVDKLYGFHNKQASGLGVLSDAKRAGLRSNCFDIILCQQVSHHLMSYEVDELFREVTRLLSPGGVFIFVDAIRANKPHFSEVLWRFDRGAYPHDAQWLHSKLAQYFEIQEWQEFDLVYKWILCRVKK